MAFCVGNYVNDLTAKNNLIVNPQYIVNSSSLECSCIFAGNSGTGTSIYNNTIINETGDAKILLNMGYSVVETVKNNIIYQGNGDSGTTVYNDRGSSASSVLSNNSWYKDSTSVCINIQGSTTDYNNAAYASAHNALWGDPTVNASYYLKKFSPCIDAGVTISGVTEEYYGSAVDIGAFEYDRLSGVGFGLGLMNYRRLKRTKP